MNRQTLRTFAYAVLIPLLLALGFLMGGLVYLIVSPETVDAHEEPSVYPPHENSDSLRVQLEIDADGDGHWEVRHIFDDKRGVWEVGTWGTIRVTYTIQTDSMGYTSTDRYTFRLHKSSDWMWNTIAAKLDSSLTQVLLGEFSQFGQSYGDSLYHDPETDELIFQSPRYNWFLIPRDEVQGH
jgi:hypothetical protein